PERKLAGLLLRSLDGDAERRGLRSTERDFSAGLEGLELEQLVAPEERDLKEVPFALRLLALLQGLLLLGEALLARLRGFRLRHRQLGLRFPQHEMLVA